MKKQQAQQDGILRQKKEELQVIKGRRELTLTSQICQHQPSGLNTNSGHKTHPSGNAIP